MPTEGTQYEYADDPKLMSERMRATREALDEVKGGMLPRRIFVLRNEGHRRGRREGGRDNSISSTATEPCQRIRTSCYNMNMVAHHGYVQLCSLVAGCRYLEVRVATCGWREEIGT